ncbi:IRF3 factor, partial [Galbula dea]|nr:IRF3 factor [Galbula dea]
PAHREGQKLLFGPWLVDAINSGNYQGLCWIDSNRSMFRVPWKHNARKDVTSSDVEIFRVGIPGTSSLWSQDPHITLPHPLGLGTGKWEWKTNFRCALRSTRKFLQLEDHSKCSRDPHKVF